jgi:kynurenine formamidase
MPRPNKPSNWGAWGDHDERGAANFITPEILQNAAGLIRRGQVYSLSMPLSASGSPVYEGRSPMVHMMSVDGGDYAAGAESQGGFKHADDYIAMFTHTGTHIDALAHVWYDDEIYNGYPANTVRSSGAPRCGIDKLRHLVGRGVLLDLCRFGGVKHLPGDHVIQPEELEQCAAAQKVALRQGDIVLIRTGWQSVFREQGVKPYFASEPGIGRAAGEWIGAKGFAGVGADNFAVEAHPPDGGGGIGPVHRRLIRDFGCYLIEMLDLDGIAADQVHEFLFVAAPLVITGGIGSPINPLAIC